MGSTASRSRASRDCGRTAASSSGAMAWRSSWMAWTRGGAGAPVIVRHKGEGAAVPEGRRCPGAEHAGLDPAVGPCREDQVEGVSLQGPVLKADVVHGDAGVGVGARPGWGPAPGSTWRSRAGRRAAWPGPAQHRSRLAPGPGPGRVEEARRGHGSHPPGLARSCTTRIIRPRGPIVKRPSGRIGRGQGRAAAGGPAAA
jgi:hypothetical protein